MNKKILKVYLGSDVILSKVLIVYWSRYGNTKKVADSIAKGIIKAAKT